jgi:hypothetical protein
MKLTDILTGGSVRCTSEDPPRYSIIDVMKMFLGDEVTQCTLTQAYRRLQKKYDLAVCDRKLLNGRKGPVCTAEEAEHIVALMNCRQAAAFRATGVLQTKKKRVEHLYVMKYSLDDTAVKIGKSHNVESRRVALESGHNFTVEVLAIFPGKGCLELQLHKRFEGVRSRRGAGREWFNIPANDAVAMVSKTMQEIEREQNSP